MDEKAVSFDKELQQIQNCEILDICTFSKTKVLLRNKDMLQSMLHMYTVKYCLFIVYFVVC